MPDPPKRVFAAALFSGQNPALTMVQTNQPSSCRRPISPREHSPAARLPDRGYWIMGPRSGGIAEIPTRKGFEEWFGFLERNPARNGYPEYLWRNERRMRWGKTARAKRRVCADFFTRAALNFIQMNSNQVFFLYLAYPLPGVLANQGTRIWPCPARPLCTNSWRVQQNQGCAHDAPGCGHRENHGEIKGVEARGSNRFAGQQRQWSRPSGRCRSIVVSKHGGLRGMKGDLYEGGIRVPCWCVGRRKSNQDRSATKSGPMDLLPTICDLCGARIPFQTDGVSRLSAWQGQTPENHAILYWSATDRDFRGRADGDWKAVQSGPEERLNCIT